MSDLLNTLLAKGGILFATFMMKIQKPWEKYRLWFMLGLGLIIGLIIAWGIWPVQWKNATPMHLRSDFQQYYLSRVALDYFGDSDLDTAERRLGIGDEKGLWTREQAQAALATTAARNPEQAPLYQRLSDALAEQAPPEEERGGMTFLQLLALLAVVLLIVAAAFFFFVRRGREEERREPRWEEEFPGAFPAPEGEEGLALKPFLTTYILGDDFFDPSFSIEVGNDFLGECGIGMSESIGVGDPKKITAFEAWLFDKSDIRTETIVLASEYAFNAPTLRSKLSSKGDVTVLRPGSTLDLETSALRVRVLIREAEYAEGNLPQQSFFQKVTFELQAWVKQGAVEPPAMSPPIV